MDTPPPIAATSDYVGLKEELQKIASIIEQYPDQLKQRAFDLLINAYLARSTAGAAASDAPPAESVAAEDQPRGAEEMVAPLTAEEPALANAPAEVLSSEVSADTEENGPAIRTDEQNDSELEPDSRITSNIANTTDMLRRRLRLRTMSQMPWHQTS